MYEVIHYETPDGTDVFAAWISELRDQQAAARVAARIQRLALGLFGECRPLREGAWELRVDWGPGYRLYYAQAGERVVLLLAGGDKRTQSADIRRAIEHWQEWQRRNR